MSCPDCCSWCCPCLTRTSKDSKYSYVEYTQSVSVRGLQQDGESVPPEKVFEFPQEKTDFNTHPPMFVEPPVVAEQPLAVRHTRSTSDAGTHFKKIQGSPRSLSVPYTPSSNRSLRSKSATLPAGMSLSTMIEGDGGGGGEEGTRTLPRFSKEVSVEVGSQCPFALPMLEESVLQVEAGDSLPVLQFSLLYDVQRSILTVHLHHASNLPAKDRGGTSDPFVILYMMPNKEEVFESNVISRTLNPVFDQSFEFHRQLPDGIRQQTLVLRVYDHDRFSRNDLIGSVVFPLEGADLFGVVMRMQIDETLNVSVEESNSQGDLLLALCYDLMLSTIKGIVLKATNLQKKDFFGLADPYVKIYLYHNKKRISKWRSSVKRKTLVPIFNESFLFEVPEGDIESVHLKVLVMDYDRFSKNDPMGVVLIGSNVDDQAGCKHWREMVVNPNSSVSQWHVLKPV